MSTESLVRFGQRDGRGRSVGARCQRVMQAASVLGLLMLAIGVLLARLGLRGRLVATLVYCFWLAWPAGAICCGCIVVSWRFGYRKAEG